jgi:uncharacterized membrane protein YbhN (UPF0104 family)
MSLAEPRPTGQGEAVDTSLGRRFFNVRTLISFVIGFGVLAFFFSRVQIDVANTLGTMARANPALMLAAFLVYYTTFIARALRWRYMLHNAGVERPPSPLILGTIICLSWFVNCLLPAKLGDVYRAYLLRKRGRISLSMAGGTIVAERIIDFAFVLILLGASALVAFRGHMPDEVRPVLELGGAAVLLGGVGLLTLRRWETLIPRFLPARFHPIYERFHVGTMSAFGNYGWLLLYTPLGWLAEIMRFWLVAQAVGMSLGASPLQQMAVATFVALGSALFTSAAPTPGGLGAAELAIVGALSLFGQRNDIAVAAALLDRLISYWSLIVVGLLIYLFWEARGGAAEPARDLEYARRD